jgi:hypothetical protein
MLRFTLPILLFHVILVNNYRNAPPEFTEGVVYARTLFPDHPVNDILKRINFSSDDAYAQYRHLRDSLALDPANLADPMYMAAIFLSPVYSKTTFGDGKLLTRQYALGYRLEALLNTKTDTGRIYLDCQCHDQKINIDFGMAHLNNVWEKHEIDETEYAVVRDKQTTMIAGYPCSKITYTFSGTTHKPALSTRLVSKIPWKAIVWQTNGLRPSLNIQLPYRIATAGAVLKMEVEFDKDHTKKMVWEVTDIRSRKVTPEDLNENDNITYDHYENDKQKVLSDIIMMMGKSLQKM